MRSIISAPLSPATGSSRGPGSARHPRAHGSTAIWNLLAPTAKSASGPRPSGRSSTRPAGGRSAFRPTSLRHFWAKLKLAAHHDRRPAPRLLPLVGRLSGADRAQSQGRRLSSGTRSILPRASRRDAGLSRAQPAGLRSAARDRRAAADAEPGDHRLSRRDASAEPPLCRRSGRRRAMCCAMALAVACDIHPLNNLRVLKYLQRPARPAAGRARRLVPPLGDRRARRAGGDGAPRRRRFPVRRRADARRHLPRPAALQCAAFRGPDRRLIRRFAGSTRIAARSAAFAAAHPDRQEAHA